MVEVLGLYRTLPELWKIKSDDYSNRAKKAAAYEVLLTKYQEYFKSATLEDLKKKLNTLRTNFRNELRKIERNSRSGAGTDDLYESQAWFMEAMLFLKDQETPAQSRNTFPVTSSDANDEPRTLQVSYLIFFIIFLNI